jgi:hypothetical protein
MIALEKPIEKAFMRHLSFENQGILAYRARQQPHNLFTHSPTSRRK